MKVNRHIMFLLCQALLSIYFQNAIKIIVGFNVIKFFPHFPSEERINCWYS
jgi:hypothetical protein